ncbi:excitatory amino acid transporter 3-like [Embiotoca jacksoni]|uniref:excitatory amino acid transporter 3-like n=1 Tax=Embiotoca jacksoni TaxID=100190 RepID=UPI003703900C
MTIFFDPGLVLVLVFKPGFDIRKSRTEYKEISYPLILMNLGRNMVPQNLVEACFRTYKYVLVESKMSGSNSTLNMTTQEEMMDASYEEVSTLGLLTSSFVFGMVLRKLGEEITIIADFAFILYGITSCAVVWIDWYLPLGILFMTASFVAEVDNWNTFYKLGKFIGVIGIGLMFHTAINLPMVYLLLVRHNPLAVISGVYPALLRALITSSSSSTMPLTFQCCEDNLMIDRRVTRFMVPIGVYLSRSATAMYQVAAVVFITQLNEDDVELDHVIILALTATLSSIGAGVIPASGMATTFFILTAVSLPVGDAVILVVAEWVM